MSRPSQLPAKLNARSLGERLVALERGLRALRLLGAVAEKANGWVLDAKDDLGVGLSHTGKLHDHVRGTVCVGAHVKEGRHVAVDARHGAGERRARDALDASDDKRSGREDRAGGARREERVLPRRRARHGSPARWRSPSCGARAWVGCSPISMHSVVTRASGTRVLGAKGNDDLLVAATMTSRSASASSARRCPRARPLAARLRPWRQPQREPYAPPFRRHLCFRQDCAVTEKRPARQGPASLATL